MFEQPQPPVPQVPVPTPVPPAPVSAPSPQTSPVYDTPPLQRKSKRWLLIPIFLIILTVAGVGGAYAYFAYQKSPEHVMPKMFAAMREVDSMSFSLEAIAQGTATKDEREGEFAVTGKLEGMTTFQKSPRMATTLTISGTSSLIEDGTSFAFSSEQRMQGDEATYIYISEFPPLPIPMLGSFEEFEDVFTDRWIAVGGTKAITDLLGADAAAKIDEIKDAGTPSEQELVDAIDKVGQALSQAATIVGTGVEEINGKKSYRYAFTIDKDAFIDALYDISASDPEKYPEEDVDTLDQKTENLRNLRGEIWIDAESYYINKLYLTFDVASKNASVGTTAFTFTLLPAAYNLDVVVEAPEDAITLKQLMEEIFNAIMAKSRAMQADDDADGLTLEEEQELGTDPANPDSDGDTFLDGAEVDGGYNPLGPGELE